MAKLIFEDVTKCFNDVVAVDRFNLTIAEGEFVALVGPSGCGKTTSLRMLAGLESISSGAVHVGDKDVTRLAARDRNLAMVFQSYALYPHLTAAENIGFSLTLKKMLKAEIATRVHQAANRMGIAHLLHRRPRELSGGQRQRVAVARCIVREPAAFLFDEPLSNLDAKLRGTARIEITRLQKALGITTLYVTHDQVEAMTMADRIVIMEGGRIRQIGAPMDLYHNPCDLFVATFLGSPAMNVLTGTLGRDGHRVSFTTGGVTLQLLEGIDCPAGPATLGLRPERIRAEPAHAAGDLTLPASVVHVERLGAETLVQFEVTGMPGLELTARLSGTLALARGDRRAFSVPAEALYLFDAEGRSVPVRRAQRFIPAFSEAV
ncbi:ABC transporter ATP-binding protein [Pararhodobacter zhoushanensis]|uniref:ABC transporter ATP-binding protein n=1 Tax=Pararhodobacter zhoushanensis TaxID=2479545 RepID=UPI000F8D95FB|nr:ABC transporter ATP-binding protein [Pararhodobacter zhoushanensis]